MRIPSNRGLETVACNRPLRPMNNDLYDYSERPGDTLVVLVDATGRSGCPFQRKWILSTFRNWENRSRRFEQVDWLRVCSSAA